MISFLDIKMSRGWKITFSYKFYIFCYVILSIYTDVYTLKPAWCMFFFIPLQYKNIISVQSWNAIEFNHSNETSLSINHGVSCERFCNDYTFQHERAIFALSMSSTKKITLANICGPEQSGPYLADNILILASLFHENKLISTRISLQFFPHRQLDKE